MTFQKMSAGPEAHEKTQKFAVAGVMNCHDGPRGKANVFWKRQNSKQTEMSNTRQQGMDSMYVLQ
jgi:hypothetical protein